MLDLSYKQNVFGLIQTFLEIKGLINTRLEMNQAILK